MLFYNHKQEFIGIDEEGLKLLNYATLEELLSVCGDVADLFAKEPGYIHNFKSFGWIDFLLHADSDASSAIVQGNGRTFSCILQVNRLYLTAEPSNPGYVIDMVHIQSISGDAIKPHPSVPQAKPEIKPSIIESPKPAEAAPSILPNYDHITPTTLSEPGVLDIPSYSEPESVEEPLEDLYAKLSVPLSDEELQEDLIEEFPVAAEPEIEPIVEPEPKIEHPIFEDVRYTSAEKEFLSTLKVDKSYRFDPSIAAHELGLPVDLIQEFIGDFIQQAKEFKEELFEATLKGDMNNLKILSHKLKGVAANLRIEDAFETLSIINTSNDLIEIEANLKYFYTIVTKLEGKESSPGPETSLTEDISGTEESSTVEEISYESPNDFIPKEESLTAPLSDDIYEFSLKKNQPAASEEEDLFQIPSTDTIAPLDIPYDEPVQEDSLMIDEPVMEENVAADSIEPLHYDKFFIAGQLGIEHDFFDELINEYKQDALRAGKEIASSIAAFDTHSWQNTASQLKGISDNLRLNEISDQLAVLSQTNDAQEANKASKRLNSFLDQL